MPRSIIKSNNRMYVVDRGASFHMEEERFLSLSAGKQTIRQTKHYLEIRHVSGVVRSAQEARVYILELGSYLYVKLVEDSSSAFSWGRLCDEWRKCLFLATKRKPHTNNRLEDHHVLRRQIRSSRRGHPTEGTPPTKHDPSKRETLCQIKRWRKICKKKWSSSSASLIDDDAVLVKKTTPSPTRS